VLSAKEQGLDPVANKGVIAGDDAGGCGITSAGVSMTGGGSGEQG
jgi:hypothetical protein